MPYLGVFNHTKLALQNIGDLATKPWSPHLRIGVTGLSRSGKTIFICALIRSLQKGGRLPAFNAYHDGRFVEADLNPQPDPMVPRFSYESYIDSIIDDRIWPQSTRQISELRIVLHYKSQSRIARTLGAGKLTLDIVDYPGEWLLDLPLLDQTYSVWAENSLKSLAADIENNTAAKAYLAAIDNAAPDANAEQTLISLQKLFTDYLQERRQRNFAQATKPPGRFLMPADLEGSPALTFAPLSEHAPADLLKLAHTRFEAYKTHVVTPFFVDHFARIDRQVFLIDALAAANAGSQAITDLEEAANNVFAVFNYGRKNPITALLTSKIDKVLIAATKADHLHATQHDALKATLEKMLAPTISQIRMNGAEAETMVLSAIRATRQSKDTGNGSALPAVVGAPVEGEEIDGKALDPETNVAIYPGDFKLQVTDGAKTDPDVRFVRFRPPKIEHKEDGKPAQLPHIKLDSALEFLLGDRLS